MDVSRCGVIEELLIASVCYVHKYRKNSSTDVFVMWYLAVADLQNQSSQIRSNPNVDLWVVFWFMTLKLIS